MKNNRKFAMDEALRNKMRETDIGDIEKEFRKSGRDNDGVRWNDWRWSLINNEKDSRKS